MKEVTKVNTAIGIGTTIHKFVDTNVKYVFLPCISYYLPTTYMQLFSPKNYHQIHCEHFKSNCGTFFTLIPFTRFWLNAVPAPAPSPVDPETVTTKKVYNGPSCMTCTYQFVV